MEWIESAGRLDSIRQLKGSARTSVDRDIGKSAPTEIAALTERFPSHVVCSWLGNSEDIAKRHYLQVTDDHFAAAIGGAKSGAMSAQPVVQKPVQSTSAPIGTDRTTLVKPSTTRAFRPIPFDCNSLRYNDLLGDEGLEPPTSSV